tara:strand:- start:493 stop:651 length:159 start_codon:yes stop_codon:yes gene_type:complete
MMTTRKAMKIVLEVAELCGKEGVAVAKVGKEEEILEAVYQLQDYMNDLMREE